MDVEQIQKINSNTLKGFLTEIVRYLVDIQEEIVNITFALHIEKDSQFS